MGRKSQLLDSGQSDSGGWDQKFPSMALIPSCRSARLCLRSQDASCVRLELAEALDLRDFIFQQMDQLGMGPLPPCEHSLISFSRRALKNRPKRS